MKIIIEHQEGEFVISYDGQDLTVWDTTDNQRVVLTESIDALGVYDLAEGIRKSVILWEKSK